MASEEMTNTASPMLHNRRMAVTTTSKFGILHARGLFFIIIDLDSQLGLED